MKENSSSGYNKSNTTQELILQESAGDHEKSIQKIIEIDEIMEASNTNFAKNIVKNRDNDSPDNLDLPNIADKEVKIIQKSKDTILVNSISPTQKSNLSMF